MKNVRNGVFSFNHLASLSCHSFTLDVQLISALKMPCAVREITAFVSEKNVAKVLPLNQRWSETNDGSDFEANCLCTSSITADAPTTISAWVEKQHKRRGIAGEKFN